MNPIKIAIPESLLTQKQELEGLLGMLASEEERLATQRKEIQAAISAITNGIAILSGQAMPATKPAVVTGVTRKPMSAEARQGIAEGLRKSAQAKAMAKAALGAAPAPRDSAPAPAAASVVVSAPESPADVPAGSDAQVVSPRA